MDTQITQDNDQNVERAAEPAPVQSEAPSPSPGAPARAKPRAWMVGIGALVVLLIIAGVLYLFVLPVVYHNNARAYLDKGEYDHAIAEWNRAIQIKSGYAEAYCGRGTAFFKKECGKSQGAVLRGFAGWRETR